MARSSRRQRRQARSEAFLRFNPEAFALSEMLGELIAEREGSIRTAEGTFRGLKLAAEQAGPKLRDIFGEAQRQRQTSLATLDSTLSGLGQASAPFQAALAREREGSGQRLSQTLANALSELESRKLEGASGKAFAIQQAEDRYATEAGKVKRRQGALAQERGAFTQGRVAELAEKEAEREFEASEGRKTRRNQRITAGVDEEGKIIPGGPKDPKLKPGKKKKRTQEEVNREQGLYDRVGSIRNWVKRLQRGPGKGASRAQIARWLTTGQEFSSRVPNPNYEVDEKTGKTKNQRYLIQKQKVPSFPETSVSIALDLEFDGHISRRNSRELRRAGIRSKPEWRPRRTGKGYTLPRNFRPAR